MIIDERFYRITEAAEARFKARRAERERTEAMLRERRPLDQIDTPERVAKRKKRLESQGARLNDDQIDERTLGRSDLMPINYLQMGLRVARSVARITIRNTSNQVLGYGTGFLVGRRLLLTNNHVLQGESDAVNSTAQFNYQFDLGHDSITSVAFALDPMSLFLTSVELDYSLVAVQETNSDGQSLSNYGWLPLIEDEGKAILGEYVSIIQHPRGEPKQLAARENQLIDLLPEFLHYRTDTEPGSSGSPVFNDQWEIIGLHHSGVPDRDASGNVIGWKANEGVRISRVVRHIRDTSLTGGKSGLRDQIFETPPRIQEASSVQQVVRPLTTSAQQSPQVRSDGTVVWSIPVEISVKVGGIPQIPAPPPAPEPNPSPIRRDVNNSTISNSEHSLALAQLKEASTKTYYTEGKDRNDRDSYYRGIQATGDLFTKVHELITNTHKTQPKYKPAVELYPWIDLQPNLKLKSIYSGIEFDPEEFINEAFRIEAELATRSSHLREMHSSDRSQFEAERRAIDTLEASLPYNCEHSVPQSWFDKREPMRGDLHHLFACESNCNSFRGNTPYFDFPDEEEVVRTDCGRREPRAQGGLSGFEPHTGKGEIARATLYFLLRYPGEINPGTEFNAERIKILQTWCKTSPVTLHEKHRNFAIFAKQGNRNPLIDHPEWVDSIDFKKGLGQ